jgi:hypothetical protein
MFCKIKIMSYKIGKPRYLDHYGDNTSYMEARSQYVEKCLAAGHYQPIVQDNDYFNLHKEVSPNKHIFHYYDAYGRERFYTVDTYETDVFQAGCYKPYESLGFHSDEDGTPLCSNVWDDGDVNLTGTEMLPTHYAAIFDLRRQSHYWWDLECQPEQ